MDMLEKRALPAWKGSDVMRTLVIYYSKTGFAKRYAQWLEEDLACRCVPFSQRDSVDLAAYDKVVFGSSVHAGGIRKLGWFKKQLPRLRGKRLAVFFTGAMPPEEHTVEQCVAQKPDPGREAAGAGLLPVGRPELRGHGPRGQVDDGRIPQKCWPGKKDPSPEDRMAAQMVASSYDKAERKYLEPLEEYLRG
mgnify:CR=1 FL=1